MFTFPFPIFYLSYRERLKPTLWCYWVSRFFSNHRYLQDPVLSAQLCIVQASRIPLPAGIKQPDTSQGVPSVCLIFPSPFCNRKSFWWGAQNKTFPFPTQPSATITSIQNTLSYNTSMHWLHSVSKELRGAEQQQMRTLQSQPWSQQGPDLRLQWQHQ